MQTFTHRTLGSKLMSPFLGRRDAIEWEELPSFADSLPSLMVARNAAKPGASLGVATAAWIETMAADLDFTPPSEPFREPLQGLQTREVHEPDIFRLFFGAASGR